MDRKSKDNYTKLLEIEPKWLTSYLSDMVAENDTELLSAIERQDREDVEGIIERYIY